MFIVLHLADFPLQAALRLPVPSAPALLEGNAPSSPTTPSASHPYLTQPAALFSGTTKKSAALAVNPAARAAGVTVGLSAPQAIARCASLLIRTPSPAAETDASAALLAAAFTVSPLVETTTPGIVTLDAHGLAPSARAPACAAALARLALLDLHATAGVARTPLLALYAARAASVERVDLNALNLTPASRTSEASWGQRAPPSIDTSSSTLEITQETEASFLAPLPLAALDPEPALAAILTTWGLRSVADLTRLTRDDVGRRLGVAGAALWDRAHGGEPRPLHLVAPPREFSAALELEEPLETLEPLLFVLRRFLDRLTLELEAAHFVAVELDLALTLENDTAHTRSFRLPEPTRDATILFRTLHTHLDSLRTDAAIIAARLRLTPARPLVRQHGLFDTGLRDPHGFAETLARVAALLGADRLGTPVPEDTHRPDAVRLVPPHAVIPPAAPPPPQPVVGRPLRRFRPPLPARLEITDGRPTYLWTDRVSGPIATHRGPWSSSGEWWQTDRAWRRLEWDIALAAGGGLYRLLRVGDAWLLEGEYD